MNASVSAFRFILRNQYHRFGCLLGILLIGLTVAGLTQLVGCVLGIDSEGRRVAAETFSNSAMFGLLSLTLIAGLIVIGVRLARWFRAGRKPPPLPIGLTINPNTASRRMLEEYMSGATHLFPIEAWHNRQQISFSIESKEALLEEVFVISPKMKGSSAEFVWMTNRERAVKVV